MRSSSSNSRATGAVLASEGTSTSGVAAAHLSGKPGVVGGPSTVPEPTCEKQVGIHGSICIPVSLCSITEVHVRIKTQVAYILEGM